MKGGEDLIDPHRFVEAGKGSKFDGVHGGPTIAVRCEKSDSSRWRHAKNAVKGEQATLIEDAGLETKINKRPIRLLVLGDQHSALHVACAHTLDTSTCERRQEKCSKCVIIIDDKQRSDPHAA
jgi:hypothetical protein